MPVVGRTTQRSKYTAFNGLRERYAIVQEPGLPARYAKAHHAWKFYTVVLRFRPTVSPGVLGILCALDEVLSVLTG